MHARPVKRLPVTRRFPLPTRYAGHRPRSRRVSGCSRIVMLNFRSDVMTLVARASLRSSQPRRTEQEADERSFSDQGRRGRRADAGDLVVLSNVNKHFGALHVLQDIDLTIARGEVVVVIGPSGSGKSTLCRTINRLETIDSGAISIDGKPLPAGGQGAGPAARRRRHGLPVVQPLRAQDGARERDAGPDQGPQGGQEGRRGEGARPARPGGRRPRRPTSTPRSSPAASSSASRSHGRWPWTPRSCSSTSRPRRSTPR